MARRNPPTLARAVSCKRINSLSDRVRRGRCIKGGSPRANYFLAVQAPHFFAAQGLHFFAPQAPHFFLAAQALHFLPLQALLAVLHRARHPELAQPARAAAVTTAAARVLESSLASEFMSISWGG